MITIVDSGMGNVKSVANMLRKSGHKSEITADLEFIERANKIILPGVGAFDAGMKQLKKLNLIAPLTECVVRKMTPVLGICLGAQLLTHYSEEGSEPGLGWIDADVIKFDFSESDKALKIPHMGWNYVNPDYKHPLFKNIPEPMRFYFVHSFHFKCHDEKIIAASAHYGYDFACCIAKDNIMGVQFHPEKSHKYGLQLMKNFAELC